MFSIVFYNTVTDKYIEDSNEFSCFEEADSYFYDHELEFDEDDEPTEWQVLICENHDFRNGFIIRDFTVEELELIDDFDECGFDPYEGCYTYDC